MSDGELFSTDTVPESARYQARLWVADLLDGATAGLAGWALLRALERDRTPLAMAAAMALAWLALCAVGGWTGRTLWREVAGVRLVRDGHAPGVGPGLLRALTAPIDLVMAPFLLRRPLDDARGVHAAPVTGGVGARVKGVASQLPWLVVLVGAVALLVRPTKVEMVKYLGRTLTGWHCCHGTREVTLECRAALFRAVRDARGGDPEVKQVVAECPAVQQRLGE